MFLDDNFQTSWPTQLVAKVSGRFSPRTSGHPRLRTTVRDKPSPDLQIFSYQNVDFQGEHKWSAIRFSALGSAACKHRYSLWGWKRLLAHSRHHLNFCRLSQERTGSMWQNTLCLSSASFQGLALLVRLYTRHNTSIFLYISQIIWWQDSVSILCGQSLRFTLGLPF